MGFKSGGATLSALAGSDDFAYNATMHTMNPVAPGMSVGVCVFLGDLGAFLYALSGPVRTMTDIANRVEQTFRVAIRDFGMSFVDIERSGIAGRVYLIADEFSVKAKRPEQEARDGGREAVLVPHELFVLPGDIDKDTPLALPTSSDEECASFWKEILMGDRDRKRQTIKVLVSMLVEKLQATTTHHYDFIVISRDTHVRITSNIVPGAVGAGLAMASSGVVRVVIHDDPHVRRRIGEFDHHVMPALDDAVKWFSERGWGTRAMIMSTDTDMFLYVTIGMACQTAEWRSRVEVVQTLARPKAMAGTTQRRWGDLNAFARMLLTAHPGLALAHTAQSDGFPSLAGAMNVLGAAALGGQDYVFKMKNFTPISALKAADEYFDSLVEDDAPVDATLFSIVTGPGNSLEVVPHHDHIRRLLALAPRLKPAAQSVKQAVKVVGCNTAFLLSMALWCTPCPDGSMRPMPECLEVGPGGVPKFGYAMVDDMVVPTVEPQIATTGLPRHADGSGAGVTPCPGSTPPLPTTPARNGTKKRARVEPAPAPVPAPASPPSPPVAAANFPDATKDHIRAAQMALAVAMDLIVTPVGSDPEQVRVNANAALAHVSSLVSLLSMEPAPIV